MCWPPNSTVFYRDKTLERLLGSSCPCNRAAPWSCGVLLAATDPGVVTLQLRELVSSAWQGSNRPSSSALKNWIEFSPSSTFACQVGRVDVHCRCGMGRAVMPISVAHKQHFLQSSPAPKFSLLLFVGDEAALVLRRRCKPASEVRYQQHRWGWKDWPAPPVCPSQLQLRVPSLPCSRGCPAQHWMLAALSFSHVPGHARCLVSSTP